MHRLLTHIRENSLRLSLLAVTLLLPRTTLRAQDDDEGSGKFQLSDLDLDTDMDALDTSPLHFGMSDIVLLVLLVAAAYLLSKIWKGCTYIFIIVVIAIYILNYYLYP